MAFEPDPVDGAGSGPERLAAIRSADSLAELATALGTGSEHAAYFRAKRTWRDLRDADRAVDVPADGVPGARVEIDGHDFWVHGITHADTATEGAFLREHLSCEGTATVYCEQGIRPMYFQDVPGICEMDDYRWAMRRCAELGIDSHIEGFSFEEFSGLREEVESLTVDFRRAAFSLIDSGSGVYGDRFERALGDVASNFLVDHEGLATGEDFESFALNRAAAADPARLADLQRYYERTFLPQPLEREWLRRHDHELEVVTHARNARMADYAVYHNEDAAEVHLVVGAAHQPGVRYYLERFRDGERDLSGFDPL